MSDVFSAPRPRAETVAFALSALAAVFWGSNFEATRVVLQDMPPWTAAAGLGSDPRDRVHGYGFVRRPWSIRTKP